MNWEKQITKNDLSHQERKIADKFGLAGALWFIKEFGKQKVYTKGINTLIKKKKTGFVRDNLGNMSYAELVKATGFTVEWIGVIHRQEIKKRRDLK